MGKKRKKRRNQQNRSNQSNNIKKTEDVDKVIDKEEEVKKPKESKVFIDNGDEKPKEVKVFIEKEDSGKKVDISKGKIKEKPKEVKVFVEETNKESEVDTGDSIEETTSNHPYLDKFFRILLMSLIVFFGILIFIVSFCFISLVYTNSTKDCYTYNTTKESAIFNGNASYYEYFCNNTVNKTYITSPYTLQASLYNYNLDIGTEDAQILKSFNNGYNNWGTSQELFKSEHLNLLTVGNGKDVDNTNIDNKELVEELKLRIDNVTDGYVSDLDLTDYINECKIIGIYNLGLEIENSSYIEMTKDIFYYGDVLCSCFDNKKCYKLALKDGYSLYLVQGNPKDVNFSIFNNEFEKKTVQIIIKPSVYCLKSTGDGIVSTTALSNSYELHPEYSDYINVVKFGFDCSNLPKDCGFVPQVLTEQVLFVNDYTFIVENEQGQFTILGYINE